MRSACAACCRRRMLHDEGAGGSRADQSAPSAQRPGKIRGAQRAARPQRDAVFPPRLRQHRRDPADHLHADGGARLPKVRQYFPATARPVHRRQRSRPHRQAAGQLALSGQTHRRHRRRAHSRPRRSRRQRHGHPGRQALALFGLRRRAPEVVPAGHARRRHQQRRAAEGSVLCRAAPQAPDRRRLRQSGRRIHHGGAQGFSRRADPVRGFRQSFGVPAAAQISRPLSASSTTTSKARRRWRWPACSRRCA